MRRQFKIIDHKHELFSSLVNISVRSFNAVQAKDIIRLDIKAGLEGNLYIIDIKGTPTLSVNASLTFMANKVGLSHSQLTIIIFYESMVRNNLIPNQFLEDLISPLKQKLYPYKCCDKLIEVFTENNLKM